MLFFLTKINSLLLGFALRRCHRSGHLCVCLGANALIFQIEMYKCYVLPKMIWVPMSVSSSRWCTPFTVPAVPTGIKIGVSIVPWSVSRSPARALDFKSVWVNSNFKKGKVRIIIHRNFQELTHPHALTFFVFSTPG